jgi:site-specific recombinase XerD
MTPIAPHITAFFQDYLVRQRGASQHTCDTYAYSFQLFFQFASKQLKVPPSALSLEQLDAPLVTGFLGDIEITHGNTASTRNVRLAAIKSFFRFLEFRVPAALEQIRRILAIPFKKTDSRLVPYLTQDQAQAILDAPDLSLREGIRDYAMIQLALATGLRVSELIGLRIDDLTLQPLPSLLVRGKARRERALPPWKHTAKALRSWLAVRGDVLVPELFVNARGEPMSRWGFAYILRKYVRVASQHCSSLNQRRVSPHVLRHTCAMVALQATQDIRKVSLWLGHSNTQTTEVYVRADPSEKLEAINAVTPPKVPKGRFRPPDELIALLKAGNLCRVDRQRNKGTRPLPSNHSP